MLHMFHTFSMFHNVSHATNVSQRFTRYQCFTCIIVSQLFHMFHESPYICFTCFMQTLTLFHDVSQRTENAYKSRFTLHNPVKHVSHSIFGKCMRLH